MPVEANEAYEANEQLAAGALEQAAIRGEDCPYFIVGDFNKNLGDFAAFRGATASGRWHDLAVRRRTLDPPTAETLGGTGARHSEARPASTT